MKYLAKLSYFTVCQYNFVIFCVIIPNSPPSLYVLVMTTYFHNHPNRFPTHHRKLSTVRMVICAYEHKRHNFETFLSSHFPIVPLLHVKYCQIPESFSNTSQTLILHTTYVSTHVRTDRSSSICVLTQTAHRPEMRWNQLGDYPCTKAKHKTQIRKHLVCSHLRSSHLALLNPLRTTGRLVNMIEVSICKPIRDVVILKWLCSSWEESIETFRKLVLIG